jgi:very-short-patch-repair endonuclease/polyhydroxyalkanoate synthesis regulator phasin
MALGRKRTSRDPRFTRLADRHSPRPADGPRPFDDTVPRLCRYYLDCLSVENTELAARRSGSSREDPSDLEPARQTDGRSYTRGLEFELRSLQSLPARSYRPTALGAWVHSRDAHARQGDRPTPNEAMNDSALSLNGAMRDSALPLMLDVVPLNAEQRQAVRQGLSNALTVITGPPGTGKSQVVTSLVVNAVRQGRTVLFASKNNKAVDLVESRVNALGPRPVLLRLGPDAGRLAGYLDSVLRGSAGPDDHDLEYGYTTIQNRLRQRVDALEAELGANVALRNDVDRLEQQVEALRQHLGEPLFRRIRTLDPLALTQAAGLFRAAFDDASLVGRPLWARLVWPFVRKGRLQRLAGARARLVRMLDAIGGEPLDDLSSQAVQAVAAQVVTAAEYFAQLTALSEARSLEALGEECAAVTGELVANSRRLWATWLRLRSSRLRPEHRKLLGDFSAIVQILVSGDRTSPARRETLGQYAQLFHQITPILCCWAVTSLSVRGRVPFAPGLFDLLVIDEASQCDIASALPLLYRARRAVVIGDPMQLQHISTLSPRQDQDLLRRHTLMRDCLGWAYSTRSLFDLANSLCRREDVVTLREHYRCHADIIEFSNGAFYGGQLRIATDHDRLRRPCRDEPAVRWMDVRGQTVRPASGGAINEMEARAVVEEVLRLVAQGYDGSIGVVSPFRAQASRIRALIQEHQGPLAGVEFLSDTIHRFQGDERDVMIFSSAVSSGVSEAAMAFLRRNPNLFNVAISRARAALVVVGDREAALSGRVDYLARFAAYSGQVAIERHPATGMPTADLGPEYPAVPHPERVTEWERVFYRALYRAGVRPVPQYPADPDVLDFAVVVGGRRLAIAIDGAMYHDAWTTDTCRRDQIRSQRLIALGWDVMRFWVYQIRDDLGRAVNRVKTWGSG